MGCAQSTAKEATATEHVSKVDDTVTTFQSLDMPTVEEEEATVDEIKAAQGPKMEEIISRERQVGEDAHPEIEESTIYTVKQVGGPKRADFANSDKADSSLVENCMKKMIEDEEKLR
ncbi:hypothetical protein PsorP6_010354 [Peronosclerospora sorghi]|uniref:Uncharacterized protein n=1 Tax=Peronosclerospora sorghi TaxID=230839 RepID=A0ACC0VZ76_9STRA|nr:hypothetical protein PsorP6_010354 [Peronosclerospora sorghi]